MAAPTPEEIATWPPPNYDNPESRAPVVYGLTISTLLVMIIFTGARLYGKGVLRHALWHDDWLILVAALFAIGVSAIILMSCSYGLGLHIWDQKAEWAPTYNKLGFAADILFPLACSLTKISVCLTYLCLFPSRSNKIFCYMLSAFLTLYTVTSILLMLFQCRPIRGYWDPTARQHCTNTRATLICLAALNSLSDFLIYLWPAKPLWSIQLPIKQRIGLVLFFTIGCIVCVAGICRIYYLEVYFHNYDLWWNASTIEAIMSVEMNIGITCGCASGVKPVIAAIFPRYFAKASIKPNTRPPLTNSHFKHKSRFKHPETFPFESLQSRAQGTHHLNKSTSSDVDPHSDNEVNRTAIDEIYVIGCDDEDAEGVNTVSSEVIEGYPGSAWADMASGAAADASPKSNPVRQNWIQVDQMVAVKSEESDESAESQRMGYATRVQSRGGKGWGQDSMKGAGDLGNGGWVMSDGGINW